MLLISTTETNPYYNLAKEEYFLKKCKEDIFMIWRNEPAIIVGKNQNTISEINVDYVKEHSIPVVRRLTGGGAVFHDLGNINYTFISVNDSESFTNFIKFSKPIIDFLKTLNITAEFSGRNDITIDGKKISGTAQCNYKSKVMHHGTLLFSSVIRDISDSLKVKPIKLKGKGVKSVSSRVTNVSNHLDKDMTVLEFKDMLFDFVSSNDSTNKVYNLTEIDIASINELVKNKYITWEWNYGKSPNYELTNSIKYTGGNLEFYLNVDKGVIKDIRIYGDFFGRCDISDIEKSLIGINHNENVIKLALEKFEIQNFFSGATIDELVKGIMGQA